MSFDTVKILAVDDEEIFTSILEHILQPVYTVFTANSGQGAIEMAKEIIPDLILLDVLMPDISGFDVFTELRNFDATQNIPVIFITGLNNTEDEEKGFFLGAVDYITKPFCNPIVMARVRTHVEIIRHIRTIEQMCLIDALTNLPNRRGFDDRLNLEWDRALRVREPISLLFIDMDNFKHYNDTYGHPFGDLLIQTMANVFKQTIKRATDLVARWGGDEFAALLPDTDFEGAYNLAEEIRVNVANTVIPSADGTNVSLTVSIGINSITPTENDTVANFLAATDKELYIAKKAGKNRLSSRKEFIPEQQTSAPDDSCRQQDVGKMEIPAPAENSKIERVSNGLELSAFMTLIRSIPMLDVEQAVTALGGSEELYEKIIMLVIRAIPQNVKQMKKNLYEDSDLRAFGIKIHGMKGSLNQIGYRKLAKLATSLEDAAKTGDVQYCTRHYGSFQERLLDLSNQVNSVIPQKETPEENDENKQRDDINYFRNILEQAKTAAEDYDSVLAAEILTPLLKRNFGEKTDRLLSAAVNALEQFQAQQALAYIMEL